MNALLSAVNLSKHYDDGFRGLHRLNLTVESGEMLFLLGANGAGKTTTINLFLDFLRPSDGGAFVDGIEVAAEPLRAKAKLAYLPETVALYESLSAESNVRYFAGLAGNRHIARSAIVDALIRTGLSVPDVSRRVAVFSKGMRQKLGIAIALLTHAKNLILDEPTSGLDPVSANGLMLLLRELRDEGAAILLSTHDVFRAKGSADRVAIMRRGEVLAQLSREEVERTDLEALYMSLMASEGVLQ